MCFCDVGFGIGWVGEWFRGRGVNLGVYYFDYMVLGGFLYFFEF